MAKKEKPAIPETPAPMDLLTKGIEAQIRVIRTDLMGEFQNKVVDLVNESKLMAQEICFVLDLIRVNVQANFMQARANEEMLKQKKEAEKKEE